MLVYDEYTFAGPAHPVVLIVVLQPLQASRDRRVLLRLGLLGPEGVVG